MAWHDMAKIGRELWRGEKQEVGNATCNKILCQAHHVLGVLSEGRMTSETLIATGVRLQLSDPRESESNAQVPRS